MGQDGPGGYESVSLARLWRNGAGDKGIPVQRPLAGGRAGCTGSGEERKETCPAGRRGQSTGAGLRDRVGILLPVRSATVQG